MPPATRLTPPDQSVPPIERLRLIMAQLRSPQGCPWDREQDHSTLRACVIEEAYEVVAAIDTKDDENLREELGDLLLQVVFHSQMAGEEGRFSFDDVTTAVVEKLIRRHPHVFGSVDAENAEVVLQQWEEIKRAEKGATAAPTSALEGVLGNLPALTHAEKTQKKAAKVGFDWPDAGPVFAKVREELAELEQAVAAGDAGAIEDEMGDLLFSAVNLARQLKVSPEVALRRATGKFSARFQALEALAKKRSLDLGEMNLSQLDALWDEVKAAALT